MNSQPEFLFLAIGVSSVLIWLFIVIGRTGDEKRVTPLIGAAIVLIVAGLFFRDLRWLGYSLIAAGLVLMGFAALRRRPK